ncbi:MAG: response regulator [Planctomycetota bacterium]
MTRRGLRVLVVDDERPIASSISAVLERRGHTVTLAASAEEALTKPTPEVLVCDIALPCLSGLDLFTKLHERGSYPYTVFITGAPTVDACKTALQMGAADFLTKPFRLDELVRAVEAFERRRAAPQRHGLRRAVAVHRESEGGWKFERAYLSTPRCVETAARDVAGFALRCGIGPAARARVATATSELVDNARRHGYPEEEGEIVLRAETDARRVLVEVEDSGVGFDPDRVQSGYLECAVSNGLARALSLAEDLQLQTSRGRGTRARLRFDVVRVDFDEDSSVDLSDLDFFTPDLSRRVLHAVRKPETAKLFQLSPALAVVVGRLLAGPDPRSNLDSATRS